MFQTHRSLGSNRFTRCAPRAHNSPTPPLSRLPPRSCILTPSRKTPRGRGRRWRRRRRVLCCVWVRLGRRGLLVSVHVGTLGPSAPSWRPSWRPSSASWRPLGPSWGPHRAPQGGPIEGPKSAPMATAPRPKMAPIFPWSSHLGSASFHGSTSDLQKGRSGHVVRLQHWSCAKQLVRDRHQHGRPNAACWAYVARSRRPSARCEFV